jgi:hypothetical protein
MKIRMHVQDGPRAFDFEHVGSSLAIGRNPAGELVLEQDAAESVVSWDHARIDLSPREATLTDLRSTNGTYRNGAPVSGTVPLWPNDAVRFGQTGPVLTIKMIDLTPAAVRDGVRFAPPPIPVAAPAVLTGAKRKLQKPVVSETRGIALQAVQDLMAQQEEQRAAHARHRRALTTVALVALLLFLLLGGGLLWHSGKLDRLWARTGKIEDDLTDLGQQMRQQAESTADHFGRIEQEQAVKRDKDHKELMAKVDAAEQVMAQEAAKLRIGVDQLKKDLGATLDDLNRRLTAKPNDMPAAADPRPAAPRAAAARPAPRIEPGMKMDVVLKKKDVYYTGVLLGISGTEVTLQTNPNAGAKPSKFDIKDVQAFQTRDGMFALNEDTQMFEPALTYFRFNPSSKLFERSDDPDDATLAQDAQILGPVNAVKALLAVPRDGQWTIGLPLPASKAPGAIPAYHLKEIVTAKGVYTYDDARQDYTYKSHYQLATEAKEKRDEYWRQVDEKQYERRKEVYGLVTDRFRALAPYYWRRWWWW